MIRESTRIFFTTQNLLEGTAFPQLHYEHFCPGCNVVVLSVFKDTISKESINILLQDDTFNLFVFENSKFPHQFQFV